MFDQFLIRKDSLENVTENGRVTGFRFAVRIADYRGCFLSLHNGYYLTVDGVEYPNDLQKFQINGKEPRSYEELKKRELAAPRTNESGSRSWHSTDICPGMRSGFFIRLFRAADRARARQRR